MPETKAPLLEKAASVANHIARIDKATGDFSSKMAAMHKAHQEDMSKALGQLGKVIGLDVAGSGPDPVDLEGLGTTNLQTFKSQIDTMIAAAFQTELAKLTKKVEPVPSTVQPVPSTVEPVVKAVDMTEESLNKLFEAQLEKMSKMVTQQVEATMTEFAKAMYEPLDNSIDAVAHFDTNNVHKAAPVTVAAAVGIGDRTQLTQPLAKVNTEPNKVATTVVPTELTADLAKRALNGDQQAVLEFMKSARPSGVPITLTEALQKIH